MYTVHGIIVCINVFGEDTAHTGAQNRQLYTMNHTNVFHHFLSIPFSFPFLLSLSLQFSEDVIYPGTQYLGIFGQCTFSSKQTLKSNLYISLLHSSPFPSFSSHYTPFLSSLLPSLCPAPHFHPKRPHQPLAPSLPFSFRLRED